VRWLNGLVPTRSRERSIRLGPDQLGHPPPGYASPVSENPALFGDEPKPVEPSATPTPIADWVVQRLREALDAQGLTSMSQRQEAIQSAAGRPVDSLRSLTHQEGLKVLSVMADGAKAGRNGDRSAWDDRDEDTWIDRL
jgi:hypothetical protein